MLCTRKHELRRRWNISDPPPQIVRNATARIPNFRGIKYETNDLSQLTATLNEIKHGQELFLVADWVSDSRT